MSKARKRKTFLVAMAFILPFFCAVYRVYDMAGYTGLLCEFT